MKCDTKASTRQFLSGLLSLAAALALFFSAGGQPAAAQGPAEYVALAQCLNAQQTTVSYNGATGKVNFVGAALGKSIPQVSSLAPSVSPEVAARSYLSRCGSLFGLKNQATELTVKRQTNASAGRMVVRFQQVYQSIPVFGAEFIAQLDASKNLLVATGNLSPDLAVDVQPGNDATAAQQTALALVAGKYKIDVADLQASQPQLLIYTPALLAEPGPSVLVWRMDVTPVEVAPVDELVLIDAHTGAVALSFNQVDDSLARETYTLNNTTSIKNSAVLVCDETNPSCAGGDTDAVAAHTYAGVTYDFYASNFGRDSIDNVGMTLKSYVHYSSGFCNAYWDTKEMVYGDGCSLIVDDVVGHEMTHGVTQREAGLIYLNQSGAINESISDVFGEFIDLSLGDDDPSVRWLFGEESSIGVIRSLKNPPTYHQPDRLRSPLYYYGTRDSGGVHTNSGVGNKTAYLITDGAKFNGYTVTGIGLAKAQQVYYEALTNLLTPTSDYAALANALVQACNNLVSGGITTADDCTQVQAATLATEMGSKVPALISPRGAGIDATPAFSWSLIAGATQYRLQVMQGKKVLYTKVVTAGAACSEKTCSATPAVKLDYTAYKWRVQALVGGQWQASEYVPFNIGLLKPGLWKGPGVSFSISPNRRSMAKFSIVVTLSGCGNQRLSYSAAVPVLNGGFSIRDTFQASGTFAPTTAKGEVVLTNYGPVCGRLWSGSYSWSAGWYRASQAALPALPTDTGAALQPDMMAQPASADAGAQLEPVGP